MIDQKLFKNLCEEYSNRELTKNSSSKSRSAGIGTLSEKTIHALLKDYMDSNPAHQEQPFGSFIADIYDGSAIVEIQTRSFNRLRDKLDCFLPKVPVTIVHPLPATKYLSWIDVDTGEISQRRKSPKQGRPCDAMRELYRLKMYLLDPNLHFHLIFLDLDEYRLLNGYSSDKKKGSTRAERIPSAIAYEILLDKPSDYAQFIPPTLPDTFTSADFKKHAHVTLGTAQTSLNVLTYVGIVKRIGNKGRSILYERA